MAWIRVSILLVLLLLPPPAQADEATYLTSGRLLTRALDALRATTGPARQVSMIDISADRIVVRTQGSAAAHHTDEWTVGRFGFLWIDRDAIGGPEPVQDNGIVPAAEGGFFPFEDLGLQGYEGLIAEAVRTAALEEPAQVLGVSIARDVRLLPEPSYGDVRWRIRLGSGRENATVFATAAGAIIGADLSGTIRAQRLNLLTQDDWPMAGAQEALSRVVGAGETVHGITVYASYLFLEADQPQAPNAKVSYSWNYSGVRKGLFDGTLVGQGLAGIPIHTLRFSLAEVDFRELPKVKAAARSAFGGTNASISYIVAEKSALKPGAPEVTWRVEMRDGNGEEGEVEVSVAGEVMRVNLPESRRPEPDWLEPTTMASTIGRLAEEFGPDARYVRITLDRDGALVTLADPQSPGAPADYLLDRTGTRRTAAFAAARIDPAGLFSLADLGAIDAARIGDFGRRTVAAMHLDGAEVYRWTIERRMTPKVDTPVLAVEVRAGIDQSSRGGWIVFDMAGAVHEVMTP